MARRTHRLAPVALTMGATLLALALLVAALMLAPQSVLARPADAPQAQGGPAAPSDVVTVTILHTNDFHGQLEPVPPVPPSTSFNPGMARLADAINTVRTSVGADKVFLVDAGDEMQGSLLSNMLHGESTIDIFNQVGYQAATFGNHEFDWGQQVLISRTQQADYPFIAANLVLSDSTSCDTAGWASPSFATPWITTTLGTAPNQVVVGIIGVTSTETPYITIASATQGLCFKDAANAVVHYYDAVKAAGAEVVVVLSHLGNTDGGYGYGFPVYGDQSLARKLVQAGKKADLIIGGHSHTSLSAAQVISGTTIVQAAYNGRRVGRADIGVDKATHSVNIVWQPIIVPMTQAEDPTVKAAIQAWANDPWYQSEISRVVGYTAVDLVRNYNGDGLMGSFVNDALLGDLNGDSDPTNDVDMVFNNAGGLRADIMAGGQNPFTLTHGLLFGVLPFGNATAVGEMKGAEIVDLLNQSATLFKGALQVAGIRYKFYRYQDALPGPQPWAWGAYDFEVRNPRTEAWEPLEINRTYRIATNEFLAPAGQDGYSAFKYVKNISYWGDMLDGVERYVASHYPKTSPYSGALDGRIWRDGTDTTGNIVPVTVLHQNDAHGNLLKGAFVGFSQLATLIKQERAHNPTRNILLSGGDQIQGDAMMYFYKSAALGYSADGTPLPAQLQTHPMMAAMNAMGYDAMTLGNHEFNFGSAVFTSTMQQANFPVLGANIEDAGAYGIASVPVEDSTVVDVPGPGGNIKVAILGISNHRVPQYELPSNIPGLTFTNPISKAQELAPSLKSANDAVVALTHIGFTTDPKSVEVDANVDTYLAQVTNGIDAIIGAHSHTNPASGFGDYKWLPTFVGSPNNTPVIINQAYRYNNTLGQVVLGFEADGYGGFELKTRAGRYQTVTSGTPEDAEIKAVLDPYVGPINTYQNTPLGSTTVPVDALAAFTQETNAANLQADAAVAELASHGINVDFHLSGAMTNKAIAPSATVTTPTSLKVSDMFTLMPYENSLVTLSMNGPQLKAVLERGYRNYYYYKYVPGRGGYSYYTTCMLDINKGGQITYRDAYPTLPNGNNVVSLKFGATTVDFSDATKYYEVSTVNYLAAGSCNFNDGGVSLWPLSQIVHDTQYYVRDAVINYVGAQTAPISPTIEGRLNFTGYPFRTYLPIVVK